MRSWPSWRSSAKRHSTAPAASCSCPARPESASPRWRTGSAPVCRGSRRNRDAAPGSLTDTVSPGPIDTPLLRVAAEKFGGGASLDAVYAEWGQKVPVRRIGQASEMAEVIAFLASDRASYVTGADFVADGGLLAKLGF